MPLDGSDFKKDNEKGGKIKRTTCGPATIAIVDRVAGDGTKEPVLLRVAPPFFLETKGEDASPASI